MTSCMKATNYLNRDGKPQVGLNRHWLVSEKYDGQRAIWNGEELVTRNNIITLIPDWFRKMLVLSSHKLDGELYFGRGKWHMTGGLRSKTLDDVLWKHVKYIIFDIPDPNLNKELPARLDKLRETVRAMQVHWSRPEPFPISVVHSEPYVSKKELQRKFDEIVSARGEGLVIRNSRSFYVCKDSPNFLKYKPIMDSEARIIGYKPGKGKFESMLGSFEVEDVLDRKIKFSVSGLATSIRANYKRTHPIGTVITVMYTEKSLAGKPRFPRYKGIRTDIPIPDPPTSTPLSSSTTFNPIPIEDSTSTPKPKKKYRIIIKMKKR